MVFKYKKVNLKILYILLILLSLNIFFFSTIKVKAESFKIDNIEISKPFEMGFNKNMVINNGFKKAFSKLVSLILNSTDQKRVGQIKLNEIKGMIESFSIKEEKFINETYFVNLGVSFNKKKIFNYLEKKNIFPSTPIRKKFLFIPIIIDENKKDLLVFSQNEIYENWLKFDEDYHLIDYILLTEDLEDLNLLKNKYEIIEQYNFKEITNKYSLNDSIVALIFKNDEGARILSRITINDNVILKNQTFSNTEVKNENEIEKIIKTLKTIYEDYWKNFNQINTSLKLILNIKLSNSDNTIISNFEKILKEIDLIYNFFIVKFDKDFTYYQITFNGTPKNFLKFMSDKNYNFNTQNKIWELK